MKPYKISRYDAEGVSTITDRETGELVGRFQMQHTGQRFQEVQYVEYAPDRPFDARATDAFRERICDRLYYYWRCANGTENSDDAYWMNSVRGRVAADAD